VDTKSLQAIQSNADCLYTTQQVELAISRVAGEISQRLSTQNPLCLCVLNGGIVFSGKLIPQLNFPLTLDSINASRYGQNISGSQVNWLYKPPTVLRKRVVLLMDDVLDHGITLAAIKDYCLEQGAAEVFSAVLIDKILEQSKPISADFKAIETADRYLFGYGMDYQGYLRNAPGIYACAAQHC
jgi:hypoxanthine phosphoribosyltransferase